MAGAILHAKRAKGPGQRVGTLFALFALLTRRAHRVFIGFQRQEARAFRQESAAADAVRQRAVTALEERDGRLDGGQVAVGQGFERGDPFAALCGAAVLDVGSHTAQARHRKQP